MAQQIYVDKTHEMLSWVPEGTPVFGSDGNKIGKVRSIHLGDGDSEPLVSKPESFYHVPPETQLRLAQDGFVQIDCGFFSRDRFATPDQVGAYNDEGLHLKVPKNELIAG